MDEDMKALKAFEAEERRQVFIRVAIQTISRWEADPQGDMGNYTHGYSWDADSALEITDEILEAANNLEIK